MSVRIVSPIASKEAEHARPWGFTCDECPIVPPRGEEPDWAPYEGRRRRSDGGVDPVTRFVPLHVPTRCRACDTAKKRWTRMRKRLKAVVTASESVGHWRYARPKFVTFGLPCDPSEDWSSRSGLLDRLKSRLPRARETLASHGVKGGIYVLEMTSRLLPLEAIPAPGRRGEEGGLILAPREQPVGRWKHHPHVHMAAVAPKKGPKGFKLFVECLTTQGLGRLNVKTFEQVRDVESGEWRDATDDEAVKDLARYIAKYLAKDGGRLRSWGVLRTGHGSSKPPSR